MLVLLNPIHLQFLLEESLVRQLSVATVLVLNQVEKMSLYVIDADIKRNTITAKTLNKE